MGLLVPFRRRRNRYLQNRENFYEGRNYLSSYGKLKALVSGTSINQMTTQKPVKFYGLDFGTSLKEVRTHLGKPNYISRKHSLLSKHKTIYYRITIAQVKCILQLHFLQDRFFLGLIEMRSSSEEFKSEVTDLIRQKYGVENKNWVGKIVDESNHKVELKDDIVPYIVYESGDSEVREWIRQEIAESNLSKQRYYDKRSDLILDMI
jgi:hypothetical protein